MQPIGAAKLTALQRAVAWNVVMEPLSEKICPEYCIMELIPVS